MTKPRGGYRKGAGRHPVAPERKMVRKMVGMLDAEWDKVRSAAKRDGVSMAEIIRRMARKL